MKSFKKMAFTLAEILIVLGLIGIVAELTIPTLIMSVGKEQELVGLKKAISMTNQALLQFTTDLGCPGDLECTGIYPKAGTGDYSTFGDAFVKYLKVIKNCGITETGCFASSVSPYYDGRAPRGSYDNPGQHYRFITADGMSYSITDETGYECKGGDGTGEMSKTCGDVLIDVNGPEKGPNNFGRDIFWFIIANAKGVKLYPRGGMDDGGNRWTSTCIPTVKYGEACAARIIEEGWQMNY